MSHDQKEVSIEFVRAKGTLKAGAEAAGITYQTLRNEIKRSPLFEKRIREAQIDGTGEIGETAVDNIKFIASEDNKDIRSRLTANIALANWTVPGFRGESKRRIDIEHNIRVTSAVPRPNYKELSQANVVDAEFKVLPSKSKISKEDKEKLRALNRGEFK